jgi:hypothetical protein
MTTTSSPSYTKVCSCRTCEHAGLPQALSAFGRNNSNPDGYAYYCRKCASRATAEWKKAHPERAKEWRTNYLKRNRERNLARQQQEAQSGTEG